MLTGIRPQGLDFCRVFHRQRAAQQECAAGTVATPVRSDWRLEHCPVLLPARATFACAPKK